jgi:hypothetical protein
MARSDPMSPAHQRNWRFYAEALIQQAIDVLDEIDGDSDLEDGGDAEPSLASPVGGDCQIIWCVGSDDDRESLEQQSSQESPKSACGLTCGRTG